MKSCVCEMLFRLLTNDTSYFYSLQRILYTREQICSTAFNFSTCISLHMCVFILALLMPLDLLRPIHLLHLTLHASSHLHTIYSLLYTPHTHTHSHSHSTTISIYLNLSLIPYSPTGGESFVEYGMCPRDASFPDNDAEMKTLSYASLNSFDLETHGQFFWNFRTEFEPKWDFQQVSQGQLSSIRLIDICCKFCSRHCLHLITVSTFLSSKLS